MEVHIQKRVRNPALKREEILCFINFDKETPSRDAVKEAIAKEAMAKKELVVIDRIKQLYGVKQIKVTAKVYNSEPALSIEPKYKLERGKKKGEKKEEEEKSKEKSKEKSEKKE